MSQIINMGKIVYLPKNNIPPSHNEDFKKNCVKRILKRLKNTDKNIASKIGNNALTTLKMELPHELFDLQKEIEYVIVTLPESNEIIEKQKYKFDLVYPNDNNFFEIINCLEEELIDNNDKNSEKDLKVLISKIMTEKTKIDSFLSAAPNKYFYPKALVSNIFYQKTENIKNFLIFLNVMASLKNSNKKKNLKFIVGPNGSGKTQLIKYLSDYSIFDSQLKVIEATPSLLLTPNWNKNDYKINDLNEEHNKLNRKRNDEVQKLFSALTNKPKILFQETINKTDKTNEFNITKEIEFQKIKNLYKELFNDIYVSIDLEKNKLIFQNSGSKSFEWDDLSDGEKKAFYLLAHIMIAKPNSWIFIDEPETHLNPALFKKLWWIILENRSDCQFVLITHNSEMIDFYRKSASFYLIEEFKFPYIWKFKEISVSDDLPSELLMKLYGNKKKILFCEGKEDIQIYRELFNDYFVVEVGGCKNVISYTKAVNKMNLYTSEARGLIDRDYIDFINNDSEKLNKNKEEKIDHIISYNEIEMIFFDDLIIEHLINSTNPDWADWEVKNKIKKINDKIFEIVSQEKVYKQIINTYTNNKWNELKLNLIDSNVPSEDKQVFLNNIAITSQKKYDEFKKFSTKLEEEIKHIITQKIKEKLLKICNLKKELMQKMTNFLNKELNCTNYKEKVISMIKQNEYLRKELRKKVAIF